MKRRDFITIGSAAVAALTTASTASAQTRERFVGRLRAYP